MTALHYKEQYNCRADLFMVIGVASLMVHSCYISRIIESTDILYLC